MNIVADGLTLTRIVLVLLMLLIGIYHGVESFPTIAVLLLACWVTDTLDGKLARQSPEPTRLGRFDLVADLGLTFVLAICLIVWGIVPVLPTAIAMIIALVGSFIFQSSAPRKLAMGVVYGIFTFSLWQREPSLVWIMIGGLLLLIAINPAGSKHQVSDFLKEVRTFLNRKK